MVELKEDGRSGLDEDGIFAEDVRDNLALQLSMEVVPTTSGVPHRIYCGSSGWIQAC